MTTGWRMLMSQVKKLETFLTDCWADGVVGLVFIIVYLSPPTSIFFKGMIPTYFSAAHGWLGWSVNK